MELDPAKLRHRITEARDAILDRVEDSLTKHGDYKEHQELTDALNGLRVLRQEYERRARQYGGTTAENRLRKLVMAERTALENAVGKLILLAEVHGITLDDLIAMLESGASVPDIVVALNPHGRQCA